jgi:hypothetical protein
MTRARVLDLTARALGRLPPYGPWVTYLPTRAAHVEHVEFTIRLFGGSLAERTTSHGEAWARRETWSSMSRLIDMHGGRGHHDLVLVIEAVADVLGVRERCS